MIKIPAQIRRSAKMRLIGFTPPSSESISIESRTPKTGVVQLKMVIFYTGLCFKRIPQRAYATAESIERYRSTRIPLRFST